MEQLRWRSLLFNAAIGKKQHPIGDFSGKPHLMGHNHHGHTIIGKISDDL